MNVTKEAIEAACAATVLGEDENYKPFHLEPREARIALEAALPFLAPIAVDGEKVDAVTKMLWERFSSPHADDWENETHKSEYRLAASDALALLSTLPIAGEGKEFTAGAKVRVKDTGETGEIIRCPLIVQADEDDGSQGAMGGTKWIGEFEAAQLELLTAPSSPGKDGGQEVEELRREIASLEYRLDEANGHLRRLEKSAEPAAWGEVRRGSDGNLAIFSTKFNTVKARFTSGNDLKPGEKVYVGLQPASTALVERLIELADTIEAMELPDDPQTNGWRGFLMARKEAAKLARNAAKDFALSSSQSTSREGER